MPRPKHASLKGAMDSDQCGAERTTPTEYYRLDLISGPQRGASVTFKANATQTVGSAIDSDIALIDPQIDDRALVFESDASGALMITVLSGQLKCNHEPLANNKPHRHRDGAHYFIGSSAFAVSAIILDDQSHTEPLRNGVNAKQGSRLVFTENSSVHGTECPDSWLARTLFGIAALLCVAIGVSYALHTNRTAVERTVSATNPDDPSRVPPARLSLEQQLSESGFEAVVLADDELDGTPRITGYVTSRKQLNKLRQLLRGKLPRSAIDVFVQDDIIEGVRNVYRTNDVEATVASVEPGVVSVVTTQRDPHDPAFMKTAAMEDVAGLVTIDVRNEPPPVEPTQRTVTSPAPGAVATGKRVVAVVQGAPSYVVTEDDSRYFVGSSLPTGHTIEAIENQSVMLEWQGQKTRLEF